MTAPKYGPWIAHNATPDSTCPPDAAGKRGQVQLADQTRVDAEADPIANLTVWNWDKPRSTTRVIAYRILIEPVRGEEVLWREDGEWSNCDYGKATHTLRLPTLDNALIPGEYIGPDGATIVVGVV